MYDETVTCFFLLATATAAAEAFFSLHFPSGLLTFTSNLLRFFVGTAFLPGRFASEGAPGLSGRTSPRSSRRTAGMSSAPTGNRTSSCGQRCGAVRCDAACPLSTVTGPLSPIPPLSLGICSSSFSSEQCLGMSCIDETGVVHCLRPHQPPHPVDLRGGVAHVPCKPSPYPLHPPPPPPPPSPNNA